MDKIELIKKITSFHPGSSIGTTRGMSHYVGGMADTGEWYFRKLLDMPEDALERLLADLEEEFRPRPQRPEAEVIAELEQWFKDRNIPIFP